MERLVVVELFEEFGVVGEEGGDGACQRLVVLDAGVLTIGVGHGVLVRLVSSHLRGQFLGEHFQNPVVVFPFDVAEALVELADDIGEPVQLRVALLADAFRGTGAISASSSANRIACIACFSAR